MYMVFICKPGMTQFFLLKHYRTQTNAWGIFCEVYGFGSRDHGFPLYMYIGHLHSFLQLDDTLLH